jgi:hypothetical protein
LHINQIWKFYNKEENPESLINRVEIWQDYSGILLIDLFFKKSGCEQMKEVFKKKTNTNFFHHHDLNWCKLQVIGSKDIRSLLSLVNETQQFIGDSKSEMKGILAKV